MGPSGSGIWLRRLIDTVTSSPRLISSANGIRPECLNRAFADVHRLRGSVLDFDLCNKPSTSIESGK